MIWSEISSSMNELTKPHSKGRPVNPHEVRQKPEKLPDYDRMRELVHSPRNTDKNPAV